MYNIDMMNNSIISNYHDLCQLLSNDNFSPNWFMMQLALHCQKDFCQKQIFLDYIAFSFSQTLGQHLFDRFCWLVSECSYFDKWLKRYQLFKFDNVCDFVDLCLDRWTGKDSDFDYVCHCGLNYHDFAFDIASIGMAFSEKHYCNIKHQEKLQDMAISFWEAVQLNIRSREETCG